MIAFNSCAELSNFNTNFTSYIKTIKLLNRMEPPPPRYNNTHYDNSILNLSRPCAPSTTTTGTHDIWAVNAESV